MTIGTKAAAVAVLLIPGAAAMGQTSGVSHPDEVPISTSVDGIQQPVVYENPPAPAASAAPVITSAPALKPRVEPVAVVQAERAPVMTAQAYSPRALDAPAATARPDVDAGVVVRVDGPPNRLPVGTMMKVRIDQAISTRSTPSGTEFTGALTEAVERDGRVLLPVGTVLSGRVTDVHGGKRISGSPSIHLQPTHLTLPDGTRYTLQAQVIDTGLFRKTKVDNEGTIVGSDHVQGTLSAVALSTGSGAAAGAVFGGWPGALIGAGVGAGVSTVMWLKQDKQTELPAETKVVFALSSPLVVGME